MAEKERHVPKPQTPVPSPVRTPQPLQAPPHPSPKQQPPNPGRDRGVGRPPAK